MTFPTLIVEADFAGGTMFTGSPTWTNITAYTKRITTTRGRPSIEGRFQTGTASVLLDNTDGRFSPNNASGAYSPNVKLGLPIRIRATWSSTTYPVFYGSVRSWPPKKEGPTYTTVDVPLADAFYTLNLEDLAAESYALQDTDTRIGAVLDAIGFPAGLRDLDTALAQVQAVDFAQPNDGGEQPALLHLQDVAEAEAGVLFVARDGKVTFRNRVQHAGATIPSAVAFDGDDFDTITLSNNDEFTWNVFRVAREDGAQVEYDASSGAPRRVLTRDVMPMATDAQVRNVAEWLHGVFGGEQRERIEDLHFHSLKRDGALLTDLLGLELRDLIRVQHTPTGGDAVDETVAVEMISHTITAKDWQTTLGLAPLASAETADYWILGTSLLGTETVLA